MEARELEIELSYRELVIRSSLQNGLSYHRLVPNPSINTKVNPNSSKQQLVGVIYKNMLGHRMKPSFISKKIRLRASS